MKSKKENIFKIIFRRYCIDMGTTSSSTTISTPMSTLTADQEVKVYRQLMAKHQDLLQQQPPASSAIIYDTLRQLHDNIVQSYTNPSPSVDKDVVFQCPRVRFGRTNLSMPILTCGGMRMQQTWTPKDGITLQDIDQECQKNFEDVVRHSKKVFLFCLSIIMSIFFI